MANPSPTPEAELTVLRAAEPLKSTLRTAFTATGRHESTAEHTWRLCFLALLFTPELTSKGQDALRILQMCIIHDLGEAVTGDIAAPDQAGQPSKASEERSALASLLGSLSTEKKDWIMGLYDEYEAGATEEAKTVKAMDKIETLVQHNQGKNPEGFDYRFNLGYGKKWTDMAGGVWTGLREIVDGDTRRRMRESNGEL